MALLTGPVLTSLRDHLPDVVEEVIAVIMEEVPAYSNAWQGSMGRNITNAVGAALDGFITIAARSRVDEVAPLGAAIDGAYALGRGEARSGRTADAILAAYRIGARVAWKRLADHAVAAGMEADDLASFAELVFAYIDQLSAASVAGLGDEMATSGRVRQRYLDHLARQLVTGAREEVLLAAAERADWTPPTTLTAVLLPASQARPVLAGLDDRTLATEAALPGGGEGDVVLLLVPDVHRTRRALVRTLAGHSAVVGPARPWMQVRSSQQRCLRAAAPGLPARAVLDTETELAELVLAADPEARADLRERVLAPLADVRPSTRENLVETLRAWLLHLGRREAVAEALFVHPQTVRYRMGQLREAYGDRLDDPDWIRDLVVALG